MKRTLFFLGSLIIGLIAAKAGTVADGQELPDFNAEVILVTREPIPDAKPDEKQVSAPGYDSHKLPSSKYLAAKHRRVIEGTIPGLPFTFYLRLTRPDSSDALQLEENVVDHRTNHSLNEFPRSEELTEAGFSVVLDLSDADLKKAKVAIHDDPDAYVTEVILRVHLGSGEND